MRWFAWAAVGIGLAVATVARAGPPAAVSVMPLGDSITAGTAPGGYRRPMVAKLADAYGLAVTTVGTQVDPAMGPADQQPHEGHGGWRIDQLSDNLLGVNAVDPSAHGGYWLRGGHGTGRGPIHPRFVTLMAGINDINQMIGKDKGNPMSGRSEAILKTVEDRLSKLVSTLTTELPDTTVLLGGCIPFNNGLLDEHLTGATAANRRAWATADGVSEKQESGVNHWVIGFDRWIRDTYVPQTARGRAEGRLRRPVRRLHPARRQRPRVGQQAAAEHPRPGRVWRLRPTPQCLRLPPDRRHVCGRDPRPLGRDAPGDPLTLGTTPVAAGAVAQPDRRPVSSRPCQPPILPRS